MQRLKIKLSEVTINDTQIRVTSDECATSFVNEKTIEVNPGELLSLYKKIIQLARKLGYKVSYKRRIKAQITDNLEAMNAALETYEQMFKELRNGWERKLDKGIFSGFVDDAELKALSKIRNSMARMTNRSNPLGIAIELQSDLSAIVRDLELSASDPENADTYRTVLI